MAADGLAGKVEVCVSDNASEDSTSDVVENQWMPVALKYSCNERNLGIPQNFLKVVDMASGTYVWLVGDDDILLPDSLTRLLTLLEQREHIDFFYVNAFHYSTEAVLAANQPYDPALLPSDLEKFSSYERDGELSFLELVDPEISFDFLGGMFLSVFRRQNWLDHKHVLAPEALTSSQVFSHFDNTFPHLRIFATGFATSRAYFNSEPMIVCLTGAREWAPKYKMIRSFRLVEALDHFKSEGLPSPRYDRCRNFAIRDFAGDVLWMGLHRSVSGWDMVPIIKSTKANMRYPNLYFSPFRLIWQQTLRALGNISVAFSKKS